MLVLADTHSTKNAGDPPNLKVCKRGVWNERTTNKAVLPRLAGLYHFKRVGHRVWSYFQARLAFTLTLFSL